MSLDYSVELENENAETLELDCSLTSADGERYRLHHAAYKDEAGTIMCPAQTILLTGTEFDELAAAVARFRKMKEAA